MRYMKRGLTGILCTAVILCLMAAASLQADAASVKTPTIVKLSSLYAGEMTIKTTYQDDISGFKIAYAKNKYFKNCSIKYVDKKSLNRTIGNLTNGATYYVKIKAYKRVNGHKKYSPYCRAQKVQVRKAHTAYITGQECRLKYSKSGSRGKVVPYMTAITVVKNLKASGSGSTYKIRYKGKTYYLWVDKGDRKFTKTKSSYTYKTATKAQKKVVDEAMRIFKRGNTVYIRSSKVKSGTLTKRGYAFDCSGFVKYVYRNSMGYSLPKNAKKIHQKRYINGRKIQTINKGKWDRTQVKPGDILCFDETGGGRCTHVGIYLGNNEFMHAVKDYGVIVSPMNGCWTRYYMCAKRYLK